MSKTPGAWFRYTLDRMVPTRTRGYVYCDDRWLHSVRSRSLEGSLCKVTIPRGFNKSDTVVGQLISVTSSPLESQRLDSREDGSDGNVTIA